MYIHTYIHIYSIIHYYTYTYNHLLYNICRIIHDFANGCSKHCAAFLCSHDTQRQEHFCQTDLRCFGHPFQWIVCKAGTETRGNARIWQANNKKSSKILAFAAFPDKTCLGGFQMSSDLQCAYLDFFTFSWVQEEGQGKPWLPKSLAHHLVISRTHILCVDSLGMSLLYTLVPFLQTPFDSLTHWPNPSKFTQFESRESRESQTRPSWALRGFESWRPRPSRPRHRSHCLQRHSSWTPRQVQPLKQLQTKKSGNGTAYEVYI